MADGRKNNGGKRNNSGRKPKSDEEALIAKLTPLDAMAFRVLKKGVQAGHYKFFELYMQYRWGKPTSKLDVTSGGEPFTGIPLIEFFQTEVDDKKNKKK